MRRFPAAPLLVALAALLSASPVLADEAQEVSRLIKQGQQEKALERANTYLGSHPRDAQVRFLKGVILADQNKTAEAIKVFTGLTEDYPELPEPYNNLAVLYASQGQYEKAKNALEMSISTHPSYATAHENLGDIYAKMASQAYDRALQLDKSNAAAQTKLALIKDIFSKQGGRPPVKPDLAKSRPAAVAAAPAPAVQAAPSAPAKPAAPAAPVAAPSAGKPAAAAPVAPAASAPAAPAKPDESAVLKTVEDWAKAWSAKNVAAYLKFYAGDFVPPKGESRAKWEQERKERITRPKSIQVTVSDAEVVFSDATHAKVTFRQGYRSANLSSNARKTLMLIKSGDRWLIQQERVGH